MHHSYEILTDYCVASRFTEIETKDYPRTQPKITPSFLVSTDILIFCF